MRHARGIPTPWRLVEFRVVLQIIPRPKMQFNVKSYGATSGSKAINDAIKAAGGGEIFIPKGKYNLVR
jgi:hypothetical protein